MSRPTRPAYTTTDWPAHNEALKRRGSLTIWFDPEMVLEAAPTGRRGRQQSYSDAAIRTRLSIKVLFGMDLRQTTGFIGSLLRLVGLDWTAPDFSTLSRRQKRGTCERLGLRLLSIHEDTESVTKEKNLSKRSGLSDALALARQEHAILIVSDGTRLFRNVRAYEDFRRQYSGEIYSVRDDKFLGRDELAAIVEAGELAAKNIHTGTRSALEKKKSSGHKLGSPKGMSAANVASTRVRRAKSDELTARIVSVLKSDPAYRDLPHSAFADLLNRRGILTNRQQPLTEAGVRRHRKMAMALIDEQRQLDEVDGQEVNMKANPSFAMF